MCAHGGAEGQTHTHTHTHHDMRTQACQQGYLRTHTHTYSHERRGEKTAGREAGRKRETAVVPRLSGNKRRMGAVTSESDRTKETEREEKRGAAEGETVGDGGTSEIEGVKE